MPQDPESTAKWAEKEAKRLMRDHGQADADELGATLAAIGQAVEYLEGEGYPVPTAATEVLEYFDS